MKLRYNEIKKLSKVTKSYSTKSINTLTKFCHDLNSLVRKDAFDRYFVLLILKIHNTDL